MFELNIVLGKLDSSLILKAITAGKKWEYIEIIQSSATDSSSGVNKF